MTKQQHPITPPTELVEQWWSEWTKRNDPPCTSHLYVATQAAQWGADQELEACCEVFARELICYGKHVATDLRMIRHFKPPSLKEQALSELNLTADPNGAELSRTQVELIRRALEALPE